MKLYVPKPPIYKAVQWTGSNLRELISFTGKAPRFDEWFPSFEAYEEHVKHDGNTFKLYVRGMPTQVANVGDYIVLPPSPGAMNVCAKDWFEREFSEFVQ